MAKSTLAIAATWLLLLSTANAESMYSKSSPVLQLDGTSYQSLIAKSNYTSIVEFYAPWCGHCKNLKPAYEKAAKSLTGLAKVAAVNCDEEHNKPFCGSMGVQGFPTLKIVKPGKKAGRPIVEDYQGARSAKAIVDAVIGKIPNHIKRLKDSDYSDWLEENDKPKAILFSDKGTTSALLKSIAIDFLGGIEVAQIRDKEQEAVEVFGVSKYPTLVLLPGDDKDPLTYDGDMKKEPIVEFLSQAAKPNPDPAPKDKKSKTSPSKSKASKDSSSFAKASASDASKKASSAKASQTSETLEDDSNPIESPEPQIPVDNKPVELPVVEAISTIVESLPLQQTCLNTKSGPCILALTPENEDIDSKAVPSLSEIHHKHSQAKRNLFPFYQLPSTNPSTATLREKLSLSKDTVEIIAVNGKRNWYRIYPSKTDFSVKAVEDWIDAIRMGDLPKTKIPDDGLIVDAESLPTDQPVKIDRKRPEQGAGGEGGGEKVKEDAKYWHDKGLPLDIDPEAGVKLGDLNLDVLPEKLRKDFMESVSEEDYEKIFGTKKGDYEEERRAREEAQGAEGDGEEGHTEL